MTQLASPPSSAFSWTQRLYDAVPLSPVATGTCLALTLTAVFFAQEAALLNSFLDDIKRRGRIPLEVAARTAPDSRSLRITVASSSIRRSL